MSFWKRKILGRSDEKTNSVNASTKIDTAPPVEKPAATATVGPPPTATAYLNSTTPRELSQVTKPKHEEAPPPTFHVFQPKSHEDELPPAHVDEDDSSDAAKPTIADVTGNTTNNNYENLEKEEEIQQQKQEEWDLNEAGGFEREEKERLKNKDDRNDLNALDAKEDIMTPAPCGTMDDVNTLSSLEEAPKLQSEEDDLWTPMHTEEEMPLILRNEGESTPLSPKFDFLKESVPLQQLQDSTSKRRHESLTGIHELDCKLASLHAKLAHESMDRGKTLNMTTLNEFVTKQLEAVAERCGTQFFMPPDGPIHSRMAKFEANRMRHVHVKLPDAVADELESPHEYITQELQASLRLEASKSDKRIGGSMVRRFDSIAGTAARRYQEEAASRRASLVQVQSFAQMAADLDEQRAGVFLESIKGLRESLNNEREERKARDKELMDLILERTTELKRALLEAAGTGNA